MKLEKLFVAFPPPKFLLPPFTGLAFSDSGIRAIQFSRKGNEFKIDKYKELSLAPGIISNGQVNNEEVLVKALQDLKRELNLKYVKTSLPEEKAYLFTAKLPIVRGDELLTAIESKIEENVPVPQNELIFDYKYKEHREKEHLDVVVSTLQISVAETYVRIAEKAQINLLSLEIESHAIARALFSENSSGTSLVVYFGLEKVGLFVVRDRIVNFTSTIPIKGDSLANLDFISQEIKRLFMYWHSLKDNVDRPERKITEIVVCGENFSPAVVEYLSTHNQTRTILGNVWTNVFDINKIIPEIQFTDSLKYVAAIGLALPSENLL